nr:hypothetical protein Iba_scaffold2661CG0240 [Ipomoea batatas]
MKAKKSKKGGIGQEIQEIDFLGVFYHCLDSPLSSLLMKRPPSLLEKKLLDTRQARAPACCRVRLRLGINFLEVFSAIDQTSQSDWSFSKKNSECLPLLFGLPSS